MRRTSAHARLRRTYAVLAGVLWLLGIEVLPNLHLAAHEKPHTHAVDGTVITVTFDRDAHRHADGTVHSHAGIEGDRSRVDANDAPARSRAKAHGRRSRVGVLAIDHAPDTHTAAGLAHRAAAIHDAPPLILDAVPVDRAELVSRYPRTGRDAVALIATCDARGPPSA